VAHRFAISSADDIDDAVQEVCLKLSTQARRQNSPKAEDSILEAYLKACIANAAHDYFRAQRARRRDVLACTPLDDVLPADLVPPGATNLERGLLIRQIEGYIEGTPRDRSVFLLYYRQGWTAKEISAIPSVGLNQKGVESLIFRMTVALRKRLNNRPGGEPQRGFSQPGT
jgi:RNA polymerase sigma-70 factor (ECF subfamily)